MKRLTSEVTVGKYRFRGVVSVEIESSWETLTDTCRLVFPRKINWRGQPLADGSAPLLRRGDTVTVKLGYDDANETVFEGFVHRVRPGFPVEVDCQDAAWLLKQKTVTHSWAKVSLKTLLATALPDGMAFECPNVELGRFRVSKATAAQVLDELKSKYSLHSWVRGGKLWCGLAIDAQTQRTHRVVFTKHVVEHDLDFQKKEDVRIKVKGISILPDNKKIEYEEGADDGEQRTIHAMDKSLDDLKIMVKEAAERLRYEGYRGTATIFGQPVFRHGDVADFRDPSGLMPEGRYLVKKVATTFGADGFRQRLDLDARVPG